MRLNMKTFGIWLFLIISLQGFEASFRPSVTCLVINLDYVICSWSEWGSPEVNSTFFHNRFITQYEHMEECSTYLQEKGYAVRCRLEYKMTDRFSTLKTRLVHQNKTFEQKHDLRDKVKLYPPTNLSVVMSKTPELNLYWNNSKINHCFESEVRYRINNDKWQSTFPRLEQTYSVAFPSKNSKYEFQVRTRMHNSCGESKFWSDWSQIILWDSMKGNNTTDIPGSSMPLWKPLLSFLCTLVLIMLACMLIYGERERLRFILIPIVPNPGKNLKDLLDSDNKETWLHVSKDVCFQPNFTERACSVREYTQVPQGGSISESESNLSIPTDQSDCLSTCSSSASTLPATSENKKHDIE